MIAGASFEGHRLAREIHGLDPATPLPFIREYRVLGSTDEGYDTMLGDSVEQVRSSLSAGALAL